MKTIIVGIVHIFASFYRDVSKEKDNEIVVNKNKITVADPRGARHAPLGPYSSIFMQVFAKILQK